VTLGILYHMPFWRAADGSLWEAEGSFARYVDSLAPYFDEIVLSVPVFDTPQSGGSRVRAANVTLAPLPYFPGPRQFYPKLATMWGRLRAWVDRCDVIHLRVPSPAAIFAFRIARARRKPVFLLVVGDYEALLPHLGYRGLKYFLFARYVAFEERALRTMTRGALTFANGAALREKHERQGARVHETKTSTLSLADIGDAGLTAVASVEAVAHANDGADRLRLLTVSRIDPRKGLRVLPAVVAALTQAGHDAGVDMVGPVVGQSGDAELQSILDDAKRLGVAERVTYRGPIALDQLMPLYRDFDVFVLPTKPGEGIPRVLLEAMANGVPVVTTAVSGITSLITHEQNGLLVPDGSAASIAAAVTRIAQDGALRRRLIGHGFDTARAHTIERQAEQMMCTVSSELQLSLRRPSAA
jgi:glycosyltransferase involved in cell wall biosynthesis